jgi:hypothetical protein
MLKKKPTKLAIRFNSMQQSDCVICLGPLGYKPGQLIPCKHEFHEECISKWLLNADSRCPLCKRQVVQVETDEFGDGQVIHIKHIEKRLQPVYYHADDPMDIDHEDEDDEYDEYDNGDDDSSFEDDEIEYEVRRIIGHRHGVHGVEYLVEWEPYHDRRPSSTTWEPRLHCKSMSSTEMNKAPCSHHEKFCLSFSFSALSSLLRLQAIFIELSIT